MSLEFQIYDYVEDHELPEKEEENSLTDYIIHVFGRTMEGKSVYAKVTGFTPHFYISLPDDWDTLTKKEINEKLKIMYNWLIGKDNKKIWYKYKSSFLKMDLKQKKKAEGFTNDKIFNFGRLVFNNLTVMKKFSYLFENNELFIPNVINKPTKFKLYESNLSPMLRCFHINKISGCSWICAENYTKIKKNNQESLCDIEINIDWENFNPIFKDNNAPLIIASFDIECYSHDGQFPQAYRKLDEIIQIGVSYTRLGESQPYRKWIACLDKTDPIPDIIVESYETEYELIEAWKDEINNNDCDIITGYNIFYFDEKYIYDRCDKILGLKSEISYLSKLKNKSCNFKEMKLESSALGQNILNFWETPGRVHIDLMKDVQKTYNLSSYKLDLVASNFIRGEMISYEKLNDNNDFTFICKSVDDIQDNDYIHIEIIKGFVSDDVGEKYIVYKIDRLNNILYIRGDSILDAELEISKKHNCKIFWSQAKDDVGPKDIFRMQKEGPAERAIVAKYCIKDCSLVNLLINKLEVVNKNIEMANVCFVPLGYLFTRGQGIKLFSLCLKEFREQNIIYPVKKVKKDKEGNLESVDSYEGAIVFDPVPQIDYEANSTKDYASLYPSSILHKNMSDETEIIDPKFDNLEGITYFNASFNESDGKITYVRYAKKDNKLGVIPTILDNLMKERKAIKKLMKTEKNPFKYKILDAKQLAVKVTANSLYGQLGAPTSPILNRNIAACTTSTGREMLLFAKKYDEEILPWLINGLKDAYSCNDSERVNHLLDKELKARNDVSLIKRIENYSNNIKDLIFQPVIRYGDTDSVFCCFRFREDTKLLDDANSLIIFNKIITFGKKLIKPFLIDEEREIFCQLYDTYFPQLSELTIPIIPECEPIPDHNEKILPLESRIKQFLHEYIYENYLPWLWTLQEIVSKNYSNMDIKLYDWAEYLLKKYRLNYNNLCILRENEVIPVLIDKINKYFIVDNKSVWFEPSTIFIEEMNTTINDLYSNDIDYKKEIKKFLKEKMKEEWIEAKDSHDPKLTIEKRKLKRERLFNNKQLYELIKTFIESNLKLTFNKYKIKHETKIHNFINNKMKNIYCQPWWDIINGQKVYKIKFYYDGRPITDKRTLELSIELGILSGELVKSRLPFPHDLEYEKTFYPFLILTKKRYVGNKYEFNSNDYKLDYMGIVLKRRDNSPIVKEICNGIIDFLINKKDPYGAKQFAEECLNNMFLGLYDIKYFLQSRTLKLKESYKDWTKIAHVYLSEQIALRDAGNKPQSGDRIEFVVVKVKNDNPKKKLLQGQIIETPVYIKQNNIPIDYMFYMKNQIMKPALQFLKLVDPNAEEMFKMMEEKYNDIPIIPKKPKVVREKKPTKKIVKIDKEPNTFGDIIKEKKERKKKNKELDENNIEENNIIQKKERKKKNKELDENNIDQENNIVQKKERKKKNKELDENNIDENNIVENNIVLDENNIEENNIVQKKERNKKNKKLDENNIVENNKELVENNIVENNIVQKRKERKEKNKELVDNNSKKLVKKNLETILNETP